jgi:hypothetical protein
MVSSERVARIWEWLTNMLVKVLTRAGTITV